MATGLFRMQHGPSGPAIGQLDTALDFSDAVKEGERGAEEQQLPGLLGGNATLGATDSNADRSSSEGAGSNTQSRTR